MDAEIKERVRQSLPAVGNEPAREIAYRAGVTLEQAYEALVWMEARGMARVICDYYNGREQRGDRGWSA